MEPRPLGMGVADPYKTRPSGQSKSLGTDMDRSATWGYLVSWPPI